MYSYLNGRKQGVTVYDKYGSFGKILYVVPRGSTMGSLLFDIFVSNLFLILNNIEIASYADDKTFFEEVIIRSLERTADDFFM